MNCRVSLRLGATTAPFQDSLALPVGEVTLVEPAAHPGGGPARELLLSAHAGGVLLWAGHAAADPNPGGTAGTIDPIDDPGVSTASVRSGAARGDRGVGGADRVGGAALVRLVHGQRLGGGIVTAAAAAAVALPGGVAGLRLAIATGPRLGLWDETGRVLWESGGGGGGGNTGTSPTAASTLCVDIRALAFSPRVSKPRLFTGDSAGRLASMDYTSETTGTAPPHVQSVPTSVSVQMLYASSHGGASNIRFVRVVAGFVNGCCGVYDDDLTHLCQLLPPKPSLSLLVPSTLPVDPLAAACFSDDGVFLCTAHRSGTLKLWSASSLFRSTGTILRDVASQGLTIDNHMASDREFDDMAQTNRSTTLRESLASSLPSSPAARFNNTAVASPPLRRRHSPRKHAVFPATPERVLFQEEIKRQLASNNGAIATTRHSSQAEEDGGGNSDYGDDGDGDDGGGGNLMVSSAAASTRPRLLGTGNHGDICTGVAFVGSVVVSAGTQGNVHLHSTKSVHRGKPRLRPLCSVQLPSAILGITVMRPPQDDPTTAKSTLKETITIEEEKPEAIEYHIYCGCASRLARLDASIVKLTEKERQNINYQTIPAQTPLNDISKLKIVSEKSPAAFKSLKEKSSRKKPMKGAPSSTLRSQQKVIENADLYASRTSEFAGSITTAPPLTPGTRRAKGGAEWTSRVSSNGKPKARRPQKSDHAFRQQQPSPRKMRVTSNTNNDATTTQQKKDIIQMSGPIALLEQPLTHAQEVQRQKQKRKLRQRQIQAQIESSKRMQQQSEKSKTAAVAKKAEQTDQQAKHYQTAQVRPRVQFATPETAWLERDSEKLATPFSPEKLPSVAD